MFFPILFNMNNKFLLMVEIVLDLRASENVSLKARKPPAVPI